ncbi:hypothetical protein LX64_03349 [Chitinophaga skermanii]|uniref:Uncharacterized protein n=1 Tax=Chitinophaga skermanii TaxID=331697 RepID=A0A327QEN8_9BACT|nr:hypothetical protein LX64_03349 [Chitinophaga skermanii]
MGIKINIPTKKQINRKDMIASPLIDVMMIERSKTAYFEYN